MFKYLYMSLFVCLFTQMVQAESLQNDGIGDYEVNGKTVRVQLLTLGLRLEEVTPDVDRPIVLPTRIADRDVNFTVSQINDPIFTMHGTDRVSTLHKLEIDMYAPRAVYNQVLTAYGCELLGKKALDPVEAGMRTFIDFVKQPNRKPVLSADYEIFGSKVLTPGGERYHILPLKALNNELPELVAVRFIREE